MYIINKQLNFNTEAESSKDVGLAQLLLTVCKHAQSLAYTHMLVYSWQKCLIGPTLY